METPALLTGRQIQGVEVPVHRADVDRVRDDEGRGPHAVPRLENPLEGPALHVQRVDVTITVADDKDASADGPAFDVLPGGAIKMPKLTGVGVQPPNNVLGLTAETATGHLRGHDDAPFAHGRGDVKDTAFTLVQVCRKTPSRVPWEVLWESPQWATVCCVQRHDLLQVGCVQALSHDGQARPTRGPRASRTAAHT